MVDSFQFPIQYEADAGCYIASFADSGKNTVWHVFEHVLLHSFLSGKHLGKASLSEL